MKTFAKKILFRIVLLTIVVSALFAMKLPRSYYFSIPEKTDFSKMTWIENKLNATPNLDSTVVFMGSSICFNGINDSLMNAWDTSSTEYINLGLTHTCYAIIDALLENMVVDRNLRPKKVLLCFKGDAMARNIHNMYSLVAESDQIIHSVADGNMLFVPSFLKRASWNVNAATRFFKHDDGDERMIFHSNYGFEPQRVRDSVEVEKIYKRLKAGSEANFASIEQEAKGGPQSFKLKLLLAKVDYLENVKFQRNQFEKSAALLDKYGIDYDIILYPNMISARMEKEYLMADYIKRTFKNIDYSKHEVITVNDPAFKDATNFVDMNHLNPKGAAVLTKIIYEKLSSN
jgi:hypothetical protein